MEFSEEQYYDGSETDSVYSDDSQEDPNFDVLEETGLSFSKLSLKKKSKIHVINGKNEKEEEEPDVIEMVMPELDEQDQKSYETIQKIIEAGGVETMKVDQCKIYLRKHGLRLSGKKETLIQRIKEHIEVVNGGGEKKYPASGFVLNCKGDACMGDIVIFEQNVYEVFNIASRSACGPPCGTRVVAGRIVKESYGAAKQQHTFTIEVLWSKGEKPLPPLHPLLIKGRNLYRLKTMRQKWDNEGERQRILSEKHARGGVARSNREARIQQKEIRKMHTTTREKRNPISKPEKRINQSKLQQQPQDLPQNLPGRPNYIPSHVLPENFNHFKGPLQRPNFNENRGYSSLHGFGHNHILGDDNMNIFRPSFSQQTHAYHGVNVNGVRNPSVEQKQICPYYVKGRCYYGDRCKYLHEPAAAYR